MRFIGNVDDKSRAERITAWLITHNISTHCEQEDDHWAIWVRDEDQIDVASQELETFLTDPDAPRYRSAVDEASRLARQKAKKLQQARNQQVQISGERWNAPIHKVAPLTVTMAVICGVVFLMTDFGDAVGGATFRALSGGSVTQREAIDLVGVQGLHPYNTRLRMASLSRGEIWRTITPIFVHFGVLHLLFNMCWLVVFGRQIEFRYGSLWFLGLVVMIAIPSNIAGSLMPAEFDGTPIANLVTHWTILAGGMSGVVYGLFGYVWMKMIFDRRSGLQVSFSNTAILLVWLVICMAPGFEDWFGFRVGNWSHGIGLAVGLAIGYWPKLISDLGFGKSGEKPG